MTVLLKAAEKAEHWADQRDVKKVERMVVNKAAMKVASWDSTTVETSGVQQVEKRENN